MSDRQEFSVIKQALQGGAREKVQLATKFGITPAREVHGDPAYVRAACEGSLARLGVDCIDLYYQHRIYKNVPVEITVSPYYVVALVQVRFI